MKTSELKGAALDWAVAKCEGVSVGSAIQSHGHIETAWDKDTKWENACEIYAPSTNWSQGGPIIEREKISVWSNHSAHFPNEQSNWQAEKKHFGKNHRAGRNLGEGKTPLEAAMRCYVASKLGDEVEIPEELQS